jgi:hypothetical protein
MATQAILLRDVAVHAGNLYWLVEQTGGEAKAMFYAINAFDGVLGYDGTVRSMAIITYGDCFMAASVIAVVDGPHDVAIGACAWIIR